MKKIALISVLICFLASSSYSQLFFSAHRDRIIMDFSADVWGSQPDGVQMKSLSRSFNIALFRDIRIGHNFSLGVGIGMSGNNLYTSHIYEDSANSSPWTVPTIASGYNFKEVSTSYELKSNKLFIGHFNLPVELRYRNYNTQHLFRVYLGVRGGYLSSAQTKVALENPNGIFGPGAQTEYRYKELNVKNINKFMFGLTARLAYGRFGLNAFLPLTPVFKENLSTQMNFFSVGVSMFML